MKKVGGGARTLDDQALKLARTEEIGAAEPGEASLKAGGVETEAANDDRAIGRFGSAYRGISLVWVLVAVQALCGAYFLSEIITSIFGLPALPLRWETRELIEIGASLGLIFGAFAGVLLARRSDKERSRAVSARRITSGQFADVVSDHFKEMDLTDAETEVAWLLLKGMSILEIAQIRKTREGTVRAQCTAIYKKAGVTGKSQLVAQLVEDVLL
ncbi:MAG: helix-turn-helix transcriptional regulator [Pseudomonadota bacterium]